MHTTFKNVTLLSFITLLSACGEGSGGGTTTSTATGVFRDATTAGLSYSSGAQSGVTNANGEFTYEVGQPVTFTVGNITVGSATGSAVMTPVDLVSDGTSASSAVINIVRTLTLLDSDGDPSNGITISSAMRTAAASFGTVNVGSDTPDFVTLKANADGVTGETHTLLSEADAKTHIEGTLACNYSGGFSGGWTGTNGDTGRLALLVSAKDQRISGTGYITKNATVSDAELAALTGAQKTIIINTDGNSFTFNQSGTFTTGTVTEPTSGPLSPNASGSGSIRFNGTFPTYNRMTGDYTVSSSKKGTFVVNRVGNSTSAVYRATGTFAQSVGGNNRGLFTIDVDKDNKATVLAYSTATGTTDTATSAAYNTSTNKITGTMGDGTNISLTVDLNAKTLTGTFNHSDGGSGTVTGSTCRLN